MGDLVDGIGTLLETICSIGSGILSVLGELIDFVVVSFKEGDPIGILLSIFIIGIVVKVKNLFF